MTPNKPDDPAGRELGQGYKYVSLGLTFAVSITLFLGLGYLADQWLKTVWVFTVIGALLGTGLSFFWVIQKLKADEARYRAEHDRK